MVRAGSASFWRRGDPFVLGTGAALLLLLASVGGVVFLLAFRGLGFFWPKPLVLLETKEGSRVLGEPWESEAIPRTTEEAAAGAPPRTRTLLRTGNRKETGADFVWVEDDAVTGRSLPGDALYLERLEWGPAIALLKETRVAGAREAGAGEEGFEVFERLLGESRSERRGRLAPRLEEAVRTAVLLLADGREIEVPLASVVRAVRPNALRLPGRLSVYLSRLWEFVAGEPRESNTEGGSPPRSSGPS